jgi:hypothetical protein
MHRAVLTLLVGLMLLASSSAHALSLNCERTTKRHDGFATQQAFESWFPRYIRPTADDQVPASKDNQVRFQINGAIYDLTISKWMTGKLPEKGGYKSVTGVRYECNASSTQVKVAFQKNNKPSEGSKKTATNVQVSNYSNARVCSLSTVVNAQNARAWSSANEDFLFVTEARRRGLTCGVSENVSKKTANALPSSETVAELEAERRRRIQLEQEIAALQAQKEQQQAIVEVDNQGPLIDIVSVVTSGKQGLLKGRVSDNTGVAELVVDGKVVPVTGSGSFEYRTFVLANGISVKIQATDLAGLTSILSVSIERSASTAIAAITFDRLNPLGKQVAANPNALALIVGVADYENTPAKAIFADSDALVFSDYASEKLGIPENRIKTLVDDGADIREVLLGVKRWLARSVKQEQSDVYVFFAGHGLASDDGEKMFLLPYDGAPELLEDTAVSRDRLFSEIAAANPRSVTVFLDTCYSGTTRGTDMLVASRPIAIRAKEQAVPEGFTVMTAAAGDQTAKPLEEAKHGMFSYFLMKGMEGDADANQDNKITAGELHAYVQQNVIQQSSGSQTPELQGDADRVLVRFQ